MTHHDIIDYIDEYLEANQGFLSSGVIDFALDLRSFVNEVCEPVPELVEAA